ncbi:MAG TPA: Bax inhibitor-1/YccA family protein [Anaerolineae bacterium]|nr:Bax inhibitor-1/YccA family protein [Anaerolineae bacterium]HMR67210.1 Bax inhibitor-1/YccA family protein [Anaerolineae bacterium]
MAFRTGNPALTSKTFTDVARTGDSMTIQGTVNKTFLLLLLALASAYWVWSRFYANGLEPAQLAQSVEAVYPWLIGGSLGGLVVAIVTVFKKSWAMVTGPIYALLEGLVLGGLSAIFEAQYPGIVFQAVGLTFGTLGCLLLAYTSRMIQPSENFKLGIVAATGGIFLIYLATFILGFFGIEIPYIHGNGLIGIGFSVFVVIIAALNLVLDFDFIENGARHGAPKYMEWYAAFGLIVTLIWLYIEILRLLAKIRSRD